MMYHELDALFAEQSSPTHCATRVFQERVAPVATLLADFQAQIGLYRRLLIAAELAPHDNAIDPKLHMLHTALEGMDAASRDMISRWRDLARSMVIFDRDAIEARADLALYAANNPPIDPGVAGATTS